MKTTKNFTAIIFPIFLLFSSTQSSQQDDQAPNTRTRSSIVFATLGRPDYNFDIYTLLLPSISSNHQELRLTDGKSVNFNGHFVHARPTDDHDDSINLVYVTERGGQSSIYLDTLLLEHSQQGLQVSHRVQRQISEDDGTYSMKDRPSVADGSVIYVSTHHNPGKPRSSWAAVYATDLIGGKTRRLTPLGQTDFSPAVSPSGKWTAVASYGEGRGWEGEVQELNTDIYIFLTRDGSSRVKLVEHGGWPCWIDESTLYFHRKSNDGWWSVYKATFHTNLNSVRVVRVTPPGVHAFTPAAVNHTAVVVATSRPDSEFRHIELFNLQLNEFTQLTRLVSPNSHHLNPFISPDRKRVGYHKCRGDDAVGGNERNLYLENLRSPSPQISLFRFRGSFPSFSPDGDRIAFVDFPGVYIANIDGTGRRQISNLTAFSTAWDPVKKGVLYTSIGPTFAPESSNVDVVSIAISDSNDISVRKLTTNGENNAFPSPSPDGQRIVFRSSRSGHKNLYIMDSIKGEGSGVFRLTEGEWTDTMCVWSPNGDLIAFASDRDSPGSGSFELYLIHPNGTGLRKLVASGSAGRANHPWFSPNGKHIVFTSDYAGVSAEPISNMHSYQPYGDIFVIGVDGSGLVRLTHNSYEDGTPTWVRKDLGSSDVVGTDRLSCDFEECHWLRNGPGINMPGMVIGRYHGNAQCGSSSAVMGSTKRFGFSCVMQWGDALRLVC